MRLNFWQRTLAVFLSAALMIKASRGLAQEDVGDYRHEFYREDDHRMSIDTDSASFDLGLGSHVRLQGEWTLDSISGATPNGTPPQSQWKFPSQADFYNQAYPNVYNSVLNNQIAANYSLYTAGYFPTYQAFTNYVATDPGINVAGQARTAANSIATNSYQSIVSSPNYHKQSVPTTFLSDLRRAGSFTLPVTFGINTITPQLSISEEHDYHSYGFALNDSLALNQKNTTITGGVSHDSDRVLDRSVNTWFGKVSDDFLVGLTQLLTPKSYLTADFTYGNEYGYLNDPYRSVYPLNNIQTSTGDGDFAGGVPENRPRHRTKQIIYASYTQFFDTLNGSVDANYRFFHDSFGIFAQTVETSWHQKIGKHFIFTPSFRYYYQTAANFYSPVFQDGNNLPQYYSSDYRLSNLESFTLGAALHYRVQKHFGIDISYSRYIMRGLNGDTSQSAYPSANVYSIGGRIWL